MNRRTLLKLLAATAIVGCDRDDKAVEKMRVVVVGAGIIGASIAYHLAKGGAQVTVIDRTAPASHASRGTFAWINATWAKQPRSYHELSQLSVAYWQELHRSLDLPVRWGGSLEWFSEVERQDRLREQIAEQVEWGEPARMVDSAEFRELEPGVLFDDDWAAAMSPNDGAVDPIAATKQLLAAATALGATVEYPAELNALSMTGGRLSAVATSAGPIPADRVVLATGAEPGIAQAVAGIEVPQRSTPGIIAITEPRPPVLNRIIAAPGIHMHQRNDGRVVIGEQDGVPATQAHARRLVGRPNQFPADEIAQQHAARMLATATRFAPELQDSTIEHVYIGWRPLPIDGHPVIGPSPARKDIYIAVMHSGVTLAPIVGRLAAQEILSGEAVDILAPYRADRDFTLIKRY